MQHYFIEKQHKASDYFTFTDKFNNTEFTFKSVDNVFSKNQIDEGTKVLLNTVLKNYHLKGDVLDFGCGLGTISIVLKRQFPNINVEACDINGVAVELTKHNAKLNNIVINKVYKCNLYEDIDKKYDYIVTNPPIKVGKKILFEVVTQAYEHLNNNGEIVLVIRKSHGQESLKNHMMSVFNNASILKRDKGYYIMKSVKESV